MQNDQKIIDVDDEIRQDDRPEDLPVITIEETSTPSPLVPANYSHAITTQETQRVRKRIKTFTILAVVIILLATIFWGYRYYAMMPEVGASVSDSENIATMQSLNPPKNQGTVVTSDSILGVAFDSFSLSGLSASLVEEMPDTTDRSLVLFMRSADYHPDGSVLGEIVIDGKPINSKQRKNRQGYVAISKEGVPVMGISLSDKVADFAKNNGGTFFRQYVLLGDGQLPPSFDLHGKVERAAIGRMADGKLFYVVSRHKETMYDFADALREYGFTDAIYLTGGNSYTFHRSPDGVAHIPESTKEKIEKYATTPPPAPLLVFRNGNRTMGRNN